MCFKKLFKKKKAHSPVEEIAEAAPAETPKEENKIELEPLADKLSEE